MNKRHLITLVLGALATSACLKTDLLTDNNETPKNLVRIIVNAEKVISGEDQDTKVTYDPSNNKFSFESGDKLQLLIGKDLEKTATSANLPNQQSVLLDMETPGVFSGTINLGTFDATDIQAAVLVKAQDDTNFKLYHQKDQGTMLRISVAANQTQNAADELTSANQRDIFFTHITDSQVQNNTETGDITISTLSLKLGNAIWEFHIYGAEYTDEKIQSISVAGAQDGSNSRKHYTACYNFFRTSSGNFYTVGGTKYYKTTVSVSSPFNVSATVNDAPALWMGLNCDSESNSLELGEIVITTDKAVYVRTFESTSLSRIKGHVKPININIGTSGSFTRYSKTIEYSIDGGTTWSEEMPDASNSYSTLVVKGIISASGLSTLADNIANHFGSTAEKVALDLSGCLYESTTFPMVFGNTGNDTNYTKCLSSIELPANISSLAASAFRRCTNLKSIQLKGIKTIGDLAFSRASALTDIGDVSSLETLGHTVFYNGPKLSGAMVFSSLETLKGYSSNNTFGGGNCKITSLSLPAVNTIGQRVFYNLTSLTTLDLGPNLTSIAASAFYGCTMLATIYCRATTPPTIANANAFTNAGSSVSGDKILYVPADAVAAYQEDAIWSTIGYTITAIP